MERFYRHTNTAWVFVEKLPREQLLASGATNVSESCGLSERLFISILKAAVTLFFLVQLCFTSFLLSLLNGSLLAWIHLSFLFSCHRPPNQSLSPSFSLSSLRPSTRWCHLWWRCQRMNPRRRRGRIRSSDKWTSIMMVRGGNGKKEGAGGRQKKKWG